MLGCLNNMQEELTERQRVELQLQGAQNISCASIGYESGSHIWWDSYPIRGGCQAEGFTDPVLPTSPALPPPMPSEEERKMLD